MYECMNRCTLCCTFVPASLSVLRVFALSAFTGMAQSESKLSFILNLAVRESHRASAPLSPTPSFERRSREHL
jgi:hypothetical protein